MNDEEIGPREAFNYNDSLKSLVLINRLLRVIDNIAYSEDVCLGPYDEEIEQAKAFLAQYNVHERYCFDCPNRMCNWCNNMNMWREMKDETKE